jgi:hypothetical protein
MRMMLFTALSLLASYSLACVEIRQPYWFVELTCEGNPQCFASSNGSYSANQAAARRFDDANKAQRFIDSFTSSISGKSPRIVQGYDSACVSDAEARRLQLSGKPCQP